ncbi:hypothetical protein SPRG_08026 [Saprolegnia parasitica CBS 223.65]|uniref:Uncharacterized protein n=1 Tax=Saprolegnia parasitica (strain CBS 223.65) TaxID=695850 RepID=A0A067CIK0_SAPPC|nr:hypothetical protein SPRG_08026 [Saprolegnia parasitica CBS 223.65]KDO26622.1 hypothetical protein SPRG_08026 [Saprolegnia parasitica CBS 223.65]|eukprot:XP_012202763.1 hypothetical protein SPRG_08026 [Saprolegnia parasitica CBS 223.65]
MHRLVSGRSSGSYESTASAVFPEYLAGMPLSRRHYMIQTEASTCSIFLGHQPGPSIDLMRELPSNLHDAVVDVQLRPRDMRHLPLQISFPRRIRQ